MRELMRALFGWSQLGVKGAEAELQVSASFQIREKNMIGYG